MYCIYLCTLVISVMTRIPYYCRSLRIAGQDQLSGFGFELSFRLICQENSPPLWPAELLQSLARYVFQVIPLKAYTNCTCTYIHVYMFLCVFPPYFIRSLRMYYVLVIMSHGTPP